jgi:hypothetical protein
MKYFSEKLKKEITPREILGYATKRNVNYVKAKCELGVKEIPTPQPKKSFRNISNNDLKCLAIYGISILGLKI